jgi:transposase
MQVNKTDKNDGYVLAQIVRTGWYRKVSVKSLDSHTVGSMLGVPAQLVGMRVESMNQTRGIFNVWHRDERKTGMSFEQRAEELIEGDGLLQGAPRSLLTVLRSIGEQVAVFDFANKKLFFGVSTAGNHVRSRAICNDERGLDGLEEPKWENLC